MKAGTIIVNIILLVPLLIYFYAVDKIYPGCGGCGTPDPHRKLIYWLGFLTSTGAFMTSSYYMTHRKYEHKYAVWNMAT